MPFLNMHRYLSEREYPVPKVYRAEIGNGLIALEDLGNETLEHAMADARSGAERASLYLEAVRLIVHLQTMGAEQPDPDCLAFSRSFDFKLLRWELEHFREWLVQEDRKIEFTDGESQIMERSFDWLARTLADSPRVLVHRDFQSRNLMIAGEERRMAVIDFQDALLGPRVYDLVALLRDSYLELEKPLVDELIGEFSELSIQNVIKITHMFRLQTVQRKLKDAGRFVFIDRVRGIPDFLPAIPLSLSYVRDAMVELPELAELHAVLAGHLPELG